MRLPDGLRLSLTTLTAFPVRGPDRLDRRTAGRAMELAPLVGVLLTVAVEVPVYLLRVAGARPLLAAALAITGVAALTRGLHLDGLADTADGLGASRDPERTRAVMKEPATGSFGVIAVVAVLLLQVAAMSSALAQHRGTLSLGLALVTGRLAIGLACVSTAAATDTGLGALVAGTARRWVVTSCGVGVPLLGGMLLALDPDASGPAAGRVALGVVASLTGLLAGALALRHVVRRVGGLTGDVLGTVCETAATASLVVLGLAPWD